MRILLRFAALILLGIGGFMVTNDLLIISRDASGIHDTALGLLVVTSMRMGMSPWYGFFMWLGPMITAALGILATAENEPRVTYRRQR